LSLFSSTVAVAITVLLPIIIGVAGYKVINLIVPPDPNPLKVGRFEAGNVPYGEGIIWVPMQYYGYVLIFTAIEPLIIIFLLLLPALDSRDLLINFLQVLGGFTLILYPVLRYLIRQVDDIKLWSFER
jgi:NADH-quinone oxidoreductase subunit A